MQLKIQATRKCRCPPCPSVQPSVFGEFLSQTGAPQTLHSPLQPISPPSLLLSLKSNSYIYAFFIISVIGSIIGFLFLNSHPAKIFLGDTGSLSLGNVIIISSIVLNNTILIPLIMLSNNIISGIILPIRIL